MLYCLCLWFWFFYNFLKNMYDVGVGSDKFSKFRHWRSQTIDVCCECLWLFQGTQQVSRNSTGVNGLKDLLNEPLMLQEFHVPASRRYGKRKLTLVELLFHSNEETLGIRQSYLHVSLWVAQLNSDRVYLRSFNYTWLRIH